MEGWGQTFYLDPVPSYGLYQSFQVRRSGDDGKRAAAPRGGGGQEDEGKRSKHPLLLGEDRLGDHAVDALADVHELGDTAVGH